MAAYRLARREPHSNAIAASPEAPTFGATLDKGATIAGEPRLALALLCGSEPGNIRLKEYRSPTELAGSQPALVDMHLADAAVSQMNHSIGHLCYAGIMGDHSSGSAQRLVNTL